VYTLLLFDYGRVTVADLACVEMAGVKCGCSALLFLTLIKDGLNNLKSVEKSVGVRLVEELLPVNAKASLDLDVFQR